MAVLRPWFGTALRHGFASGLWGRIAIATTPSVSTVPTVPAMTTMPKHVHRHERDKKQNPNPIL